MYKLIYADPPWKYNNKKSNGAAINHYPAMTLTELKQLPVKQLADKDAVLVMWFTGPLTREAGELAKAWGFKVRTMKLFTWVKLLQLSEQHIENRIKESGINSYADFMALLGEQTRIGLGNYSRSNSEDCLLAAKGKGLQVLDRAIKQIIYAPISRHSEKPIEARIRLEKLFGDVPRIELFARQQYTGWHTWGNECNCDVDL